MRIMEFWMAVLAVSLIAALTLARALIAGGRPSDAAQDVAVYRDQLKEVDRDLARGLVTEDEAETIRLEVSRRLLDADRAAQAASTDVSARGPNRVGAVLVAIAVIAGAVGVYWWIGAPGYGDLPIERRIELAEEARQNRPSQATAEASLPPTPPVQADPAYVDLIAKLRETVAERPNDLEGQMLLARHEASLGQFAAARAAQERVIEIKGEAAGAEDFAQLSDLLVMAAGGYVSPEAEAVISQTLTRDPQNGTARYYSGLLAAQTGRPDVAFRIWRALLETSPPDAAWVPPIRAQIEGLAQLAGVRYTLPPVSERGPTAEDMQVADEMAPEARQAMIENMVAGLAERLATEGGPPEDWARLIRAYGVMGRTDEARTIWEEAQSVFPEDALASIQEAARAAGVAE